MKIDFVKSAGKELGKLDKRLSKRLLEKIQKLSNDPYGQDSQKLAGGKGYRVRLGNYRIVYIIDKPNKLVTIIKIGHRREIYRL